MLRASHKRRKRSLWFWWFLIYRRNSDHILIIFPFLRQVWDFRSRTCLIMHKIFAYVIPCFICSQFSLVTTLSKCHFGFCNLMQACQFVPFNFLLVRAIQSFVLSELLRRGPIRLLGKLVKILLPTWTVPMMGCLRSELGFSSSCSFPSLDSAN